MFALALGAAMAQRSTALRSGLLPVPSPFPSQHMQARMAAALGCGTEATLLRVEFLAVQQEPLEAEPVLVAESRQLAALQQVSKAVEVPPASPEEQPGAKAPRLSGFLLARVPG